MMKLPQLSIKVTQKAAAILRCFRILVGTVAVLGITIWTVMKQIINIGLRVSNAMMRPSFH
jgi:hypothetical protein